MQYSISSSESGTQHTDEDIPCFPVGATRLAERIPPHASRRGHPALGLVKTTSRASQRRRELRHMQEVTVAPLAGWDNFYVIVGSSAGALTGLMFVVITIVAGNAPRRSGGGELAAYGTPNVVHFCAVLFLAAMLSAPWESLHVVGVLLVAAG